MSDYTGPGELVPESGPPIAVQLELQTTADGWGGLLRADGGLPLCVHAAFNRRLPLTVRVGGRELVLRVAFISRSGRAEVRGESHQGSGAVVLPQG